MPSSEKMCCSRIDSGHCIVLFEHCIKAGVGSLHGWMLVDRCCNCKVFGADLFVVGANCFPHFQLESPI